MALRVRDPGGRRMRVERVRLRRPRPPRLAAVGFLGGLAAGVLLASQQLRRHRRDLFSPRVYERLVALSALRAAAPSVETLRLLQDYVGWEPRPLLRRRGAALLRRLERAID
jgi:hypothetical protein